MAAKNLHKPPPSGLSIGDIVYTLFKHKWKIIFFSLLALGAAAAYYRKAPVVYASNAKLLVRYVLNRNAIDNVDSTTTPGATRGPDSVMISQITILQSRDLARSVVEALAGRTTAADGAAARATIEPDPKLLARISPKSSAATLETDATGIIMNGITATTLRGSNILDVTFKHADREVASRVLDIAVKKYLAIHLEIYRSKAAAAEILEEVQLSETQLNKTEAELLKLRAEKEFLTLDGAIAGLNSELSETRTQLSDAITKLAEQQARVAALTGEGSAGSPPSSAGTPPAPDPRAPLPEPGSPNANGLVQGAPDASSESLTQPRHPLIADGTMTRYQAILSRLNGLRTNTITLLAKFTPDSEAVRLNEAQVADMEAQQAELESAHPELIALARGATAGPAGPVIDLVAERAALKAAEVRKQALEERIKNLLERRAALINDAPTIAQAERNQIVTSETHKYLLTSKKKAEVDQKLSSDNIPNIDVIQQPTPGIEDVVMRNKIALGIAGGGPALTIGLVLLGGVLLNRTIKRPAEFEAKLGLPVMVAIPYFKRLRKGGPAAPRLEAPAKGKPPALTDSGDPVAPWDPDHCIRPHAEALRDRLGLYFEVNGIDHKPKLIAVTGQTPGAGASTVASGIAAALSEVGDGKVLLVDMGGTRGAAHPFFDGRPAPSLSNAICSSRGADEAADNLFLAKADGNNASITAPIGAARLSRMMPDLKASYFDYIIFDMPALGNTSPTPSMAAFMDQVIVVVASEQSTPEEILRQHRDLTDTHAKVSMVLNKVKPHGPRTVVGSI